MKKMLMIAMLGSAAVIGAAFVLPGKDMQGVGFRMGVDGLSVGSVDGVGDAARGVEVKRGGWLSLFDGKTLNGWEVGENAETFSIENGCIVAHGKTAHLFYEGDIQQHNFKDFDFKAHVMTEPGSNSGIYIHTQYQEGGWPAKGYEVQVNNSHTDWRRTGSLYAVEDVKEVYVKDKEWFWEEVIVKGKHIVIKLNDKTVVDYTEPDNVQRPDDMKYRVLSSGTFALQGHDPNSKVYFKDIMVKPL